MNNTTKIHFSTKNQNVHCYCRSLDRNTLETQLIDFKGEVCNKNAPNYEIKEMKSIYSQSIVGTIKGAMTIYAPQLQEVFDSPKGILYKRGKDAHSRGKDVYLIYAGNNVIHFHSEDNKKKKEIDQDIRDMIDTVHPGARIALRNNMYAYNMDELYNVLVAVGKKLHLNICSTEYMRYAVDEEKITIDFNAEFHCNNGTYDYPVRWEYLTLKSISAQAFARTFGAVESHPIIDSEVSEISEENDVKAITTKHNNTMSIVYNKNRVTSLTKWLRSIENTSQRWNKRIKSIKRKLKIS